jgi:carboxylesterase
MSRNGHRGRVLMLHGLCSSSLEVRHLSRRLRNEGFDVVLPTLPGYSATADGGGTEAVKPDFRRWIADCTAEIDRIADSHDGIAICGVSLGATLALAVAAERPKSINGLSLISTTLFFDGWNVSRWRFLLPLAYYTPLGRFYRYREIPPYGVKNPRVRAFIANELATGTLSSAGASTIPTASLREADRLIRHVKRSVAGIGVPTLMIHARDDDVASLRNVRFVRERVASTHFREFIVNDSYHMITLDNDRDHAAQQTAKFLGGELAYG